MPMILANPIARIQKAADQIGMYRVVSGTLSFLALLSIIAGALGYIAYSPLEQIFALMAAILVALSLNWIIALVTKIPANHESAIITALILFFLAIPGVGPLDNWPLLLAVAIAITSKYVLVYKRQHFVNPAAVGAVALSLAGIYSFGWWVANPVLFIPLLLLGSFVVMKIRKWVPVLTFILVSLLFYTMEAISYGDNIFSATETFFLSWPTLFLAFYMLTEPFTMPATKKAQFLYGGVVGFLSSASIVAVVLPVTPELALVLANIIMMPWRLRQKLFLELLEKRELADSTYEFIFKKPAGLRFNAGQYLEWMLPHEKADSRGVRRYFTIASSPTEPVLRVALKVVDQGSSYKNSLMNMEIGEKLIASQLAGDFVLPEDKDEKIGFIAGGIGVTPFRSHLRYMQDTEDKRDVVLYYCVNSATDVAYRSEFIDYVDSLSLDLVQVLAKEDLGTPYEKGYFSSEMVRRRTPDYLERHWYISGPPGMVNACTTTLKELGVKREKITKDFFPGLA